MSESKKARRRERRGSQSGSARRHATLERLDLERFEPRYAMAALFPYDQTFKLDSLPTATKTIFLDFTGHRTQGTKWNSSPTDEIVCLPFTLDGSPTFSTPELDYIQEVWAHVSEEFRPFNVNVSTREANGTPVLQDIVYSGPGDDRWGIRCVISDSTATFGGAKDENPSPPAQGVAFLGSFQSAVDTPCFVRIDTSIPGVKLTPLDTAFVATHEVGHSLGLEHHGISSVSGVPNPIDSKFEYYPGHTNGVLSWGPIMGAPYGQRMTQWSHGEYASASRPYQDDLAIITSPTGVSGFSYRVDDHGNAATSATTMSYPAGLFTATASGLIEQNTDSDMFRINVSGPVTIEAKPYTFINPVTYAGANLDIGLRIYAADGATVVAVVDPQNQIDASFLGTLGTGTFFVSVFGSGNADPLVNGYTNYGSLGTYSLSVTTTAIPTPSQFQVSAAKAVNETQGASSVAYDVILSPGTPAPTGTLSVDWSTMAGTAQPGSDYIASNGTATVSAATGWKATIIVPIVGDATPENDETFTIVLTNPSPGATVSPTSGSTVHTILNDDGALAVGLSTAAQTVTEGHIGKTAVTVTATLNTPAGAPVTVTYTTQDGSATAGSGDYEAKTGTITIPAGQTTGTATVFVLGDRNVEGSEAFSVALSNPVGAVLGALANQTVTIVNDDVVQADPGITVSSPTIREGNSGSASMVFTITLSRAVATATTLWVRTVDGTATAGTDYVALPPTQVTIAKNRRQATVTVKVKGDRAIEQNEVFYLDVSRNASFTSATRGTGTIVNDDLAPIKAAFASLASATPSVTTKKKLI